MSNANKMKEVAGILGLEIGEKFNVVYNNGEYLEYTPHTLTEEGVIDRDGDGTHILTNLLLGRYTIEKLPFRPKEGQRYYTCDSNLIVLNFKWTGCCFDLERKLLGVVFRTEKEVKEYLPIFKRRLEGEEV